LAWIISVKIFEPVKKANLPGFFSYCFI